MQLEVVKDYYGKQLKSSKDLKTSACCDCATCRRISSRCSTTFIPKSHPNITVAASSCRQSSKAAACSISAQVPGATPISWRNSLAAGEVVGVDMTDEQLATANGHLDWQQERFGYPRSNVRFLKGYIEKLDELDLAPESFDVIVSNCVINLSVDKPAVFRGAHRLLKTGGELYFSDVYCDRRLPDYVRADPVLYGECLGGALYWNDFLPIAKEAGFLDPRLVTSKPIGITNEAVKRSSGSRSSSPRPIACSSSMASSRPARTMAGGHL